MVSLYLRTFALTYHGWEVARCCGAHAPVLAASFVLGFERCVSLSEAKFQQRTRSSHSLASFTRQITRTVSSEQYCVHVVPTVWITPSSAVAFWDLTSCQPIIDSATLREVYFCEGFARTVIIIGLHGVPTVWITPSSALAFSDLTPCQPIIDGAALREVDCIL